MAESKLVRVNGRRLPARKRGKSPPSNRTDDTNVASDVAEAVMSDAAEAVAAAPNGQAPASRRTRKPPPYRAEETTVAGDVAGPGGAAAGARRRG